VRHDRDEVFGDTPDIELADMTHFRGDRLRRVAGGKPFLGEVFQVLRGGLPQQQAASLEEPSESSQIFWPSGQSRPSAVL
jgi:hypothetical protein